MRTKYQINWMPNKHTGEFTNHKVVSNPRDVYDSIITILGCYDTSKVTEAIHNAAANAEGWCEIPGGEEYRDEHNDFSINVFHV